MNKFVDNTIGQELSALKNEAQRKSFRTGFKVTVKDFVSRTGQAPVHFIEDPDKQAYKHDNDEIIIEAYAKGVGENEKFYINTGNYIGTFYWDIGQDKKLKFEISSRFSTHFLKRMVSFANDIYLSSDNEQTLQKDVNNTAEYIVYFLFTQALERAFLLGVPKSYQSIRHDEPAVKGKVDINGLLRNMPFKGIVPSVSRERIEDQNVINILHATVNVVSKYTSLEKRLLHIIPYLKQFRKSGLVTRKTINVALSSKALTNSMFAPYKRVLKLAELVLDKSGNLSSEQENDGVNFVLNVAELFEVYTSRLLALNFPDWSISSPKLEVYKEKFFQRKIIPDIVMKKGNNIIVFDTKYKRMNFTGRFKGQGMGDVDRNDFFQIHTYLSYYLSEPNNNVLAAGLIYPLSGVYKKEECQSNKALGNNKTLFVIDGIELSELEKEVITGSNSIKALIDKEQGFINRVREMIEQRDERHT